jgi:hypothetical protein
MHEPHVVVLVQLCCGFCCAEELLFSQRQQFAVQVGLTWQLRGCCVTD